MLRTTNVVNPAVGATVLLRNAPALRLLHCETRKLVARDRTEQDAYCPPSVAVAARNGLVVVGAPAAEDGVSAADHLYVAVRRDAHVTDCPRIANDVVARSRGEFDTTVVKD